MAPANLLELLDSLARPKVLVLGDLILDRYTWGNAERISQEAPVIVLKADHREARAGGAANVANMVAGLEGRCTCLGVVGADAAGDELRQLLHDAGVDCAETVKDNLRPTSVKERFVGRASSRHPNQILRVDQESTEPLAPAVEDVLIAAIEAQVPRHGALLISDYGKGVCTPRVLRAAIDAANRADVPVLIDPSRSGPLHRYRGATLIKPNRVETEMATGMSIVRPDDALAAGQALCRDLHARMALVTIDRDGMALATRDGDGELFATQARNVYDITGAGDIVLAMMGLCFADGVDVRSAIRLSNLAAGLEVERAGVAVIRRDELRDSIRAQMGAAPTKVVSASQAATLAESHRREGSKVVFTNGCFDLLHVGHATYLAEAAEMGDVLIVGVNTDASVRRLKGPSRPVIGEQDRAAMLAALACVDYVVLFEDDTPLELIHAIRPDVLVKGGTYCVQDIVGHDLVTSYGGVVRLAGVVEGISTSNILASLARGTSDLAPGDMRSKRAADLRRAG